VIPSEMVVRRCDAEGKDTRKERVGSAGCMVMLKPDPEPEKEVWQKRARMCEIWWISSRQHVLDVVRAGNAPDKKKLLGEICQCDKKQAWVSSHFSDEPLDSIITIRRYTEIKERINLSLTRYLEIDFENEVYKFVKYKNRDSSTQPVCLQLIRVPNVNGLTGLETETSAVPLSDSSPFWIEKTTVVHELWKTGSLSPISVLVGFPVRLIVARNQVGDRMILDRKRVAGRMDNLTKWSVLSDLMIDPIMKTSQTICMMMREATVIHEDHKTLDLAAFEMIARCCEQIWCGACRAITPTGFSLWCEAYKNNILETSDADGERYQEFRALRLPL
ncbi:hypothetical protein PENSPDRAFT_672574, partial [Peniophora sp. CONT]